MNEETTHPWILHIISHGKGDGGCWVNHNYFCLCPLGDSNLLEGKIRSHSFFWVSSILLLLLDLLCASSISWKQTTLELRSLKPFLWVRNWKSDFVVSGSRSLNYIKEFSQGWSHLKARLGLEDPFPRWLTHMTGKLEVVVGKRLTYYSCKPLPRAAWVSS